MSEETLMARLKYAGGDQLSRINRQKLRSLQAALRNDYNSRLIKFNDKEVRCLINTNNLKSDYDKKIISVEFEHGLQPGDVFQVVDDDTYWMVYLPILTETAYLRAEIMRCRYTLDIDGEQHWIYFQGPTETDLRWFIKSGINFNELNLSGTIYIKNTPKTKEYFKRFTKIKLDGHMWEVQVTDSITVPGIIELEIQEYYDNPIAELPDIIQEEKSEGVIIGQSSIDLNTVAAYTIPDNFYNEKYHWIIEDNPRVKIVGLSKDKRICEIRPLFGSGDGFTLSYGPYITKVSINKAVLEIEGPKSVYPYERYVYTVDIDNPDGTFSVDNNNAVIIDSSAKSCEVEIVSGKKGSFVLTYTTSKENYDLPITINSL